MQESDDQTGDNNADNTANDSHAETQAPQLLAIELRVLGTLMEKQLTTPDAYPLTVNSITTGCNQKSSREPISNYQQGELLRALQELEDKKYIRREYGSRADKYSQQFIKVLELGKKQQALLCVMMLRGPQTLSELRTRTQRMCEFIDDDDLNHCIARLCDRSVPYAIRLGNQPGQRGERFGHLFSGMPSVAAQFVETQLVETQYSHVATPTAQMSPAADNTEHYAEHKETVALLEMEISSLTKTVSQLETQLSEQRQQLTALYQLTGHDLPVSD